MARVLVVDDSAFARLRLATALRSAGYEVDEAENGELALLKYRQVAPDLALVDVTMPGIDGLATTRAIMLQDPNAVVIVMSAQCNQALVEGAQQAGARGFIHKVWSTTEILTAIQDISAVRNSAPPQSERVTGRRC